MDYADIAAYPESRLAATIRHLFSDPQFNALLEKARGLPRVFHKENIASLFHWVRTFKSIAEFQAMMFRLISFNLRTTSDGLTITGLENLDRDSAHLFLSNHRSTVLDTSYLNFVLARHGYSTVYSAAGDNLMKTPWIQHLIRLNKGFVVKRRVTGVDEKLKEARRLSAYILGLLVSGSSVWIAHRGGRAKNGNDSTDSAVLKMLSMNGTYHGIADWCDAVKVMPMTISWEQLPQDEVLAREVSGELESGVGHRDLLNILGEINGKKGRIHIAFSSRVHGERRSDLVRELDREIQSNYRLWDANWLAYVRTASLSPADMQLILDHIDVRRAERVLMRGAGLSEKSEEAFVTMYARPVENALNWFHSVEELILDQESRFGGSIVIKETVGH